MATFDSERNCYVVRVVYDGPAYAGKTTNLERICELIPTTQRSELYTPGALKGRTMFFDWLEVDGPPEAPLPIRFHLISVPGQERRNYRRRPLVEMADVVVFVADSSPEQLADTQRTFARLRLTMRRREPALPVVLQANKQDVPFALDPELLRRKLRIEDDVPLVAASALTGAGVRETLAVALRLGAERVRVTQSTPWLSGFTQADELFDHLLTFEDHPANDELIDIEELHLGAEEVDLNPDLLAQHASASSMEALEARARRASARQHEG